MAAAAFAETLRPPEIETINRRTDSILYNVYHLHEHFDKKTGEFDPRAVSDVLEQNITDVTESDIHKYGAVVSQKFDPELQQYVSLGGGTIENNIKGLRALDMSDKRAEFEVFRRIEEVAEEDLVLWPDTQEKMKQGGIKVFISPAPTHHEADPDVATSFSYDDRAMLRFQGLSADGMDKVMTSFSVFEVPAKAWAAFLGDRYGVEIEPTALAVMQFCHEMPLEFSSVPELVEAFVGGVIDYLPAKAQKEVRIQLDAFTHEQAELAIQARYYGQEKTDLQMEVARCLNDEATPEVMQLVNNVRKELHPTQQLELSKRFTNGKLFVDSFVAELVIKIKTVTAHNRAGLATLNHRTVLRAANKLGMDEALLMAEREHAIQAARQSGMEEFMVRQNEQQIAQAGLGCEGGCSVIITDLFSADGKTAREAGLKGTLYESEELNRNSDCSCENKAKAKVISDGKNVVCTTCKDYMVAGKRGSLKKSTAKAA